MTVHMLRADERPAVPWKNGGGLTREVASAPSRAGMSDFVWRVSLADVAEPGPFSRFEGVDRIITLVDGPGMMLTVDGTSHTVAEPYVPFPFSGDATTDCRLLGGPLVDFNVMARRGRATAQVEIVRDRVSVSTSAETTLLAVVLDGSAVFEESGLVRPDLRRRCGCSCRGPQGDRGGRARHLHGRGCELTVPFSGPG